MFCEQRRLPPPFTSKFAVESFLRYEIGNKFLILVAVAAAADPKCGNKILCVSPPPPACCTVNCRQQFGEKRQRGILYHQCAATSQTSLHFTHLRSPNFSRTHLYKAQINIWNSKLKLTHTHIHTAYTHMCSLHSWILFCKWKTRKCCRKQFEKQLKTCKINCIYHI